MVRKLKAFDCNDLMLDHRGPGALLFVLASDYAALEARCAALTAELKECIGNCADPSDKRRIRKLEAALNKAVGAFETIGFHLPKDNLEAVNEAILIARGFNAWYDSTKDVEGLPARHLRQSSALTKYLPLSKYTTGAPMSLLARSRLCVCVTSTIRAFFPDGVA